MVDSLDAIVAGFMLRAVQIATDASLTLLIGFLTAGALRVWGGAERLRTFFGSGRWTAPLRAWAAGILLPVCALGVLPVLYELRRAGVSRSAIFTFAITGPMLNPISLLYGVSYLGPWTMLVLVLGCFVVAVGTGVLLGGPDASHPVNEQLTHEQDAPHLQAVGPTRLAFAGVHAARLASGPVLTDLAIGIAIAALTAAFLAPAFLASSMFAGDPAAIGRMTVVAALSYLTPEQAMVCVPEMLKFRQSAGAMFALQALAGGMSLGHLVWIARAYGRKPAVLWGVMVLGLTVAAAYAVDAALPAVGTANADNDHFNRISNPFEGHHGLALLSEARRQIATIGAAQWAASALMILLVLSGFIMNSIKGSRRIDAWLTSLASASTEAVTSPRESAGLLNRPLPARWGFAMVLGLLAVLALAGAYAYYPAPVEVFRDMQIIKADLYGELSSPSPNVPLHHLDLWDRQASRLSTGARLRLVAISTEARQTTEDLREAIRSIRLAIEQGRRDEARSLFASAQKTYERCRDGYGVHD